MRTRSPYTALTAALVACLALARCGRPAAEPPAHAEAAREAPEHEAEIAQEVKLTAAAIAEAGIQTWKVEPVDLEHLLILNGTVERDENRFVELASHVSGRVASMPADLGQRVARGDPILWIESAELGRLREAYIRSLSELRAASRSYDRAKKLAEAKAISTGELQSREAGYLSIVAGVEAGERSLLLFGEDPSEIRRLRSQVDAGSSPSVQGPPRIAIRAPFAGRVLDRRVTPGTLVEAMQPLATLADLTKVWIFLQVYEKDLAQIRSGLAVRIRADAYPDDTFPGAVDFVGGVVDETTRTIRVRATVPNPSEKLRPGMFVKAQVLVPNPKEEGRTVLAVPQGALQTLEGRPHVFVETAPGRFVRRVVETGHTFEGFTEILAGVRAGEKVVTEGSFVLKSEFARAELAEDH